MDSISMMDSPGAKHKNTMERESSMLSAVQISPKPTHRGINQCDWLLPYRGPLLSPLWSSRSPSLYCRGHNRLFLVGTKPLHHNKENHQQWCSYWNSKPLMISCMCQNCSLLIENTEMLTNTMADTFTVSQVVTEMQMTWSMITFVLVLCKHKIQFHQS